LKNLGLLNKFIFIINSLFAVLLLLSYTIPHIKPAYLPLVSAMSLMVPILLFINNLFLIYWLILIKKQFLLSFFCLLLGFNYATSFYKLSSKATSNNPQTSVMSYNVRLFNLYSWIKDKNTAHKLDAFIKKEKPDILCLQEYYTDTSVEHLYPYKYLYFKDTTRKNGQAIFSNFKIINKGSLNFEKTSNNAIFADIIKNKDTIRIYNIHLESMHLNPKKDSVTKKNSERLLKSIANTFKKQQAQVELINQDLAANPYKTIICADLNNTAFSWAYRRLKSDFKDAFVEAGSGFGTTFNYNYIPLRIDFILTDRQFEVLSFKKYNVKYSDHNPIKTTLNF